MIKFIFPIVLIHCLNSLQQALRDRETLAAPAVYYDTNFVIFFSSLLYYYGRSAPPPGALIWGHISTLQPIGWLHASLLEMGHWPGLSFQ